MNVGDLRRLIEAYDDSDEVIVFDRLQEETLRVRPDDDRYDFEILCGDGELVIELAMPGNEERT